MVLARWQNTVVDDEGNIQDGATVTVRREVAGSPLASLFSDRDGLVPTGNPITADSEGFAAFHVAGGAYRITATKGAFSRVWRYVPVGTAQEFDEEDFLVPGDIGVSVQAYDAQLDEWSGVDPSENGKSLVSAANYAAMRALLDLEPNTDFYAPGGTDVAVADGGTGASNASGARTNLGLATVGQAEAEAGTSTTTRAWTAERVAQAIAALGGGGPVAPVAAGALSSQATLDIALDSADMYEIDLINLLPVSDNVSLYARFSQSSTFLSGAGDYRWGYFRFAAQQSASDTEITVFDAQGNGATELANVTFRIFRPSATSFRKSMHWTGGMTTFENQNQPITGHGSLLDNTNAIDGVRFLFSTGNISSGYYAVRSYTFT
jgi:hypothetical protein